MRLRRAAVATTVGLVAAVLLFPWYGVDSDPPQCWSIFDYVVPCHAGVAVLAGLGGAAMVGVLISVISRAPGRRRRAQTRTGRS